MRFQDKVAVITGSANGIGRATARILAGEGAYLVAVDISGPDLAALAEEIEAAGGNVTTMQVDVLDTQQVERMVDSIVTRFSRIDILVNAVGGSTIIPNSEATVDDLTLEEWDKVIQFNLKGTFLCTKAVVSQMKKQGGGKIVNLSSIAGHGLTDASSAYAVAKAGSSGPHHQDSGEAKIRESTAGVSRKPSSDGKTRGCSSKHLWGLTAWNT